MLKGENEQLVADIRQQDAKLQQARSRIAELEEMVQSQTEQARLEQSAPAVLSRTYF